MRDQSGSRLFRLWVTKMADRTPEFDGRTRADLPPGVFGMLAVLVTATIIAIFYFAREVFVPITLAVLLSFLLAPAVRWLRRPGGPNYRGSLYSHDRLHGNRRVRGGCRRRSIVIGAAAPGISI